MTFVALTCMLQFIIFAAFIAHIRVMRHAENGGIFV
jgi:hypothetical protein